MRTFGVVTNMATSEIQKLYSTVRLEGKGWYIEVCPSQNMTALEIRCSGNMEGESEMIVRPRAANAISVSSTASEREGTSTARNEAKGKNS